jgi:hypothetical protein
MFTWNSQFRFPAISRFVYARNLTMSGSEKDLITHSHTLPQTEGMLLHTISIIRHGEISNFFKFLL